MNATQKIWTGIGSRKVPESMRPIFTEIASMFARAGWTLRSGGAQGSDEWFEAATPPEQREIYLPWRGFRGNASPLYVVDQAAFDLASTLHPEWDKCDDKARTFHARNCYQILGRDLATPSRVVVAWTPFGDVAGGTATALRLAERHEIEILNLGWHWATRDRILFLVSQIIGEAQAEDTAALLAGGVES